MPGLLRGVARTAVVAGTATAVSNRVSRRQAGRWAQQEPTVAYEQEQPRPEPATGTDPTLAKLSQLADLKAQGVLTDEEFEAQKTRLLGG